MAKKASLANALKEQDAPEAVPKAPAAKKAQAGSEPKKRKSSRDGFVNLAAWFPPEVKFELEEIRLQRSRKLGRKVTLQELQNEIYNDFFKKEGRAELAPHTES